MVSKGKFHIKYFKVQLFGTPFWRNATADNLQPYGRNDLRENIGDSEQTETVTKAFLASDFGQHPLH